MKEREKKGGADGGVQENFPHVHLQKVETVVPLIQLEYLCAAWIVENNDMTLCHIVDHIARLHTWKRFNRHSRNRSGRSGFGRYTFLAVN